MQELKLVVAESDASSLVLRVTEPQDSTDSTSSEATAPEGRTSEQEFFLPVTDDLRQVLAGQTSAGTPSEAATPSDAAVDSASVDSSADAATNPSPLSTALGSLTATPSSTEHSAAGTDEKGADNAPGPDSEAESSDRTTENDQGDDDGVGEAKVSGFGKFGRTSQRPHRTKISITPRAIQDRVRHGASIEELAEEADTDPSRIEPYAWPILQERTRMADLAHSAHPVSSDGPAKNSLWEVLATSLAARGESLSECKWDAYLNEAKQWIVTVSWNKAAAGQTATHVAEFLLQQQQPGPSLAQPINSIAGDLVDPRYGQAPRRVAAVTPLRWNDDPSAGGDNFVTEADQGEFDSANYSHDEQPHGQRATQDDRFAGRAHAAGREGAERRDSDEDFLLHPDQDDRPKRRRKAVTPHWEDVLLGVRTNPRKKR